MSTDRTRNLIRLIAAGILSIAVLAICFSIASWPVLGLISIPILLPGALLKVLFEGSGGPGVLIVDFVWIWALLYFVPKFVAERRKQREQE